MSSLYTSYMKSNLPKHMSKIPPVEDLLQRLLGGKRQERRLLRTALKTFRFSYVSSDRQPASEARDFEPKNLATLIETA
jgi:hypothetical protein